MEEKIEIPVTADVKAIFATWFFRQGPQFIVTALFCAYFAWKTHQLETRLDSCQNGKVEQVISSSNAVINAVETLIGKMQEQEREYLNIGKQTQKRFKQ